ncbi:MAG: exodeoxyribonuclease VII small subunit [Peptococcaceae bacterium]|nr:exodeoxyribonuclease VII small subunit [Peptococcaceae bacterium]
MSEMERINLTAAGEAPLEKSGSFEENLARLETLVRQLERGELGLEESLARYQEGVGLIRQCQKSLDRAAEQMKILTADGEVTKADV